MAKTTISKLFNRLLFLEKEERLNAGIGNWEPDDAKEYNFIEDFLKKSQMEVELPEESKNILNIL